MEPCAFDICHIYGTAFHPEMKFIKWKDIKSKRKLFAPRDILFFPPWLHSCWIGRVLEFVDLLTSYWENGGRFYVAKLFSQSRMARYCNAFGSHLCAWTLRSLLNQRLYEGYQFDWHHHVPWMSWCLCYFCLLLYAAFVLESVNDHLWQVLKAF